MKTINEIIDAAKQRPNRRLAVAAAEDEHVLQAVAEAVKLDMVEAVLVGDEGKIRELAGKIGFDLSEGKVEVVNAADPAKSAAEAVKMVSSGNADVLMKGNVATGTLLKAVLNKEYGLRTGRILSHVAIFEPPVYGKLLLVTDAAMNVAPDLKTKVDMINNAVSTMRSLGIERPKVAVVAAVETVNPDMSATLDAAALTQMARRNQIKDCDVDGPLALDNAVSAEAAKQKKIESPVAGQADIILTPDIEAGNVLYKSLAFLAGCNSSSIITGSRAPIVLTSRADSEHAKLASIALATLAV